MTKTAEDFRGKVVTWPRMIEVLDDYLEGVRPYSLDDEGNCLLRNGARACAIGSFIADDKYHPGLEGYSAESAEILDVLVLNEDVEPWHLDALQAFHDQAAELFDDYVHEGYLKKLKLEPLSIFSLFYTIAQLAPIDFQREVWKVVSKAVKKAQVLRRNS